MQSLVCAHSTSCSSGTLQFDGIKNKTEMFRFILRHPVLYNVLCSFIGV